MTHLLPSLADIPWFPDALSITAILWLLLAAFAGSFLTAALGVGGGAFLLIVMASFVPALVLIPVHGMVQLGSNGNRMLLTRKHLRWDIARPFTWGALLATALAALLLIRTIELADFDWVVPVIALFILWLCWGPIPKLGWVHNARATASGGFLTTLATMVFGATGPLVAAWLGRDLGDRLVYTACFAYCMSIQHILKLLLFAGLGFAFLPWLPLVLLMISMGYLGTLLGLKVLLKIPERAFQLAFRCLLTLLSLRVLWTHLGA